MVLLYPFICHCLSFVHVLHHVYEIVGVLLAVKCKSLSSCVVTTEEEQSRPQQEVTEATQNNLGSFHVEAIACTTVIPYATRMRASILIMF